MRGYESVLKKKCFFCIYFISFTRSVKTRDLDFFFLPFLLLKWTSHFWHEFTSLHKIPITPFCDLIFLCFIKTSILNIKFKYKIHRFFLCVCIYIWRFFITNGDVQALFVNFACPPPRKRCLFFNHNAFLSTRASEWIEEWRKPISQRRR